MRRHWHMIISGEMGNAALRLHVLYGASIHKLVGEVRQEADRLIIDAQGEEGDLEDFRKWFSNGPTRGKIKQMDIEEKPLYKYQDFKIL
jgi:acylphosphatase